MSCPRQKLSLCSIPTLVSRDGYSGNNAHIYLPFCGFHFFDGSVRTFTNYLAPQDNSITVGGVKRTGVFSKGYSCAC